MDLTILFAGHVRIGPIWFKRVRKATAIEARALRLVYNVHRRV